MVSVVAAASSPSDPNCVIQDVEDKLKLQFGKKRRKESGVMTSVIIRIEQGGKLTEMDRSIRFTLLFVSTSKLYLHYFMQQFLCYFFPARL